MDLSGLADAADPAGAHFTSCIGDSPCLLRPLSPCPCLLIVQIPSECEPLFPVSRGTHQFVPAPAISIMEKVSRATFQALFFAWVSILHLGWLCGEGWT